MKKIVLLLNLFRFVDQTNSFVWDNWTLNFFITIQSSKEKNDQRRKLFRLKIFFTRFRFAPDVVCTTWSCWRWGRCPWGRRGTTSSRSTRWTRSSGEAPPSWRNSSGFCHKTLLLRSLLCNIYIIKIFHVLSNIIKLKLKLITNIVRCVFVAYAKTISRS